MARDALIPEETAGSCRCNSRRSWRLILSAAVDRIVPIRDRILSSMG
jgi:hypothetical protein